MDIEFKSIRSGDHGRDYKPTDITKRLVMDYVKVENDIQKLENEIKNKTKDLSDLRNYVKFVLSNIFIPIKKELLESINDEDFRILRVVVDGKLYTISDMMIDKFDVTIL